MKTLGKLVRERRESAGYMNQRDFADALERAQSWVSRLEADRMMNAPSPEELHAISKTIPLSVSEMLAAMGYDLETGSEGPSDAVRRLQPLIDSLQWNEPMFRLVEDTLGNLRKIQSGTFAEPKASWEEDE